MSNSRVAVSFILFCVSVLLSVETSQGQIEKLNYEVGDKIEVEFRRDWHEAEVIRVLPGGIALEAKFVDRPRNGPEKFMFSARQIRDIEPVEDAEPGAEAEPAEDAEPGEQATPQPMQESSDKDDPFTDSDDENPFAQPKKAKPPIAPPAAKPDSDDGEEPSTGFGETNPFNRDVRRDADQRNSARPRRNRGTQPPTSPPARERSQRDDQKANVAASKADSAAKKSTRNRPRLAQPETLVRQGRSAWRWIAFGVFALPGLAIAIWGFLNRSTYW